MLASNKQPHENSEKTKNTPELNFTPEKIRKTLTLTKFRDSQIDHLCKVGVAKNPTEFITMAILQLIRENKHLLAGALYPANWRNDKKSSTSKKSKIVG